MDNSRSPVAFLASQQTENASQVPVSAAYLASHGQPSNILSMLDTALQASSASSSPVVTVGSNLGNVQIDTGKLLTSKLSCLSISLLSWNNKCPQQG